MKNKSLLNLQLSRNQQNTVNMVASIVTIGVTTAISFFLSPYIVSRLGAEANGFVNLANNFIGYAALLKTALNSMGSRFIMMSYYNGDVGKARKYYSSLLVGDLVLSAVFFVFGFICVWKLEVILNISPDLVYDIKMLFALLFVNFIISTAITVWSIAPYVSNKLFLTSIRSAQAALIRALIIIVLFSVFNAKVYYLAVGTLISGLFSYFYDFHYKRKLLPEFRVKRADFSMSAIKELVSSGIWNSVSSLGSTFVNGLDLLITNLFVGATPMGVLSIAKTMPAFVDSLNEQIATVFTPGMIIDFAKNDKIAIIKTIKQTSKIISIICTLPLGFLIVFGDSFYRLWQPTQDEKTLWILSIITIMGRVFFSGMQPLFNIFTVVNKVKQNSIVMLVNGLISALLTFALVKTTNLGIYAVAGVSVFCCFVKNMVFVIPYSAKYLGIKRTTFYSTVYPSVICTIILCVIGVILKQIFNCDSWIALIVVGIIYCLIGFIVNSFVVLNKDERRILFSKLKK